MTTPASDQRSAERRAKDEEIALEPRLPPVALPPEAISSPMEAHLTRRQRPVAVPGVVENGLVRPLDPTVNLPEHARVIIVASEKV